MMSCRLASTPVRAWSHCPMRPAKPSSSGISASIVAATVYLRRFGRTLDMIGDAGFGGDQQAGDRGRILQRRANDLGGIDDTRRDEVFIDIGLGIEAEQLII